MSASNDHATGRLVEVDGARWYRIEGLQLMQPFLSTVVSDSDLWLFVSSAGPLTAGRIDADHAFLPYETDDRLHRAVEVTGPVSLLSRGNGPDREFWQPFARRPGLGCTRALEKHELGTALTFEEINHRWDLSFRMTWEPSRAYGWVRTVRLADRSGDGADIEVVDGLLDVMPAGVDADTERRASNLVDAYKRSETGRWGTSAMYALESGITDRAAPSESLAATLVWSAGFEGAEVHLDERVLDAAWDGGAAHDPVTLLTGRRGGYLLRGQVTVPPEGHSDWIVVADIGLGHAELRDRIATVARPDARSRVTADIEHGRARIAELLGAADGVQRTADQVADAHHLSNVLFNTMRGGIFADGYDLDIEDLLAFLQRRNRQVHARWAETVRALGPEARLEAVVAAAEVSQDADLLRLVLEYLPLSFSRRHGDPSRPWNRFSIRVTGDDGGDLLHHEGNWRDIFQNWEALLHSYPRYLPHVVATFVNASTADGHNPYRISRDGIDWEVPDPDDPWSNIGYWGDHQIVYLLRLLEAWQAFEPGALAAWLDRPLFTYADVPYRIAGYEAMLTDPRDTITFERSRAAAVEERVTTVGGDGRLLVSDGDLVRATMAEKLLVPALAKLSSYVAGGGIWMNTQRPEWNDANNALAGWGLSMVTLYQLERYLAFLERLLLDGHDRAVIVSRQVAAWLADVGQALADHAPEVAISDPNARRSLLHALGTAGMRHRDRVADGFDATSVEVDRDELGRVLGDALEHVRASVRAGRRSDGLYHAYNLLSLSGPYEAEVRHLPLMLEGQVAVLGTTALEAAEVPTLVERLFDSPLYRPDQASLLLYPVPTVRSFLDRNEVSTELVDEHGVLARLAGPGQDRRRGGIVERDAEGRLHFRADLVNAVVLEEALRDAQLPVEDRAVVHEAYERSFAHRAFTGRSSGMHGYEGIGSIYWHMVAKLLLAVQDRAVEVETADGDDTLFERLTAAYRRIRDGLGFRKDPATYGAFPTDCYSHTPAHAGAQQPGMTGQVKEEVLTRTGELGLRIVDGRIAWGRPLLADDELWTRVGEERGIEVSVCGTPVRVEVGASDAVRVQRRDGTVEEQPGRSLSAATSSAVFDRDGSIAHVVISVATPASPDAALGR